MKHRQFLFVLFTIVLTASMVPLFMFHLQRALMVNEILVENCDSSSQSWAHRCQKLLELLDNSGKPDRRSPASSVVFIKTHKTGSSTIQNILLRYGASKKLTFALPPNSNHFLCPMGMPQVLSPCWDNGKADIFALHSNCSLGDTQKFVKEDAFWFTILRQPDLLFESMYRYYDMSHAGMFGVPFEEFVSNPSLRPRHRIVNKTILPLGVNQMARDLGLNVTDMDDEVVTLDYIEYLNKTFDFFMINEYMEESLILLRHRLGLELEDIVALDVNRRTKKAEDPLAMLSKTQRRKLRRINRADHLLYDRFRAKFLQELEAFGPKRMAKELQAYHCLRESVKVACKFRRLKRKFLPGMYRPTSGPVDGFFPTVNVSAPAELYWLCHRLAYSEVPHLDMVRAEQAIQIEDRCSAEGRIAENVVARNGR